MKKGILFVVLIFGIIFINGCVKQESKLPQKKEQLARCEGKAGGCI